MTGALPGLDTQVLTLRVDTIVGTVRASSLRKRIVCAMQNSAYPGTQQLDSVEYSATPSFMCFRPLTIWRLMHLRLLRCSRQYRDALC